MHSSLVNKGLEHDPNVGEGDANLPEFCACCEGSIRRSPEQQGKRLSFMYVMHVVELILGLVWEEPISMHSTLS